jgi:hypothetical protein
MVNAPAQNERAGPFLVAAAELATLSRKQVRALQPGEAMARHQFASYEPSGQSFAIRRIWSENNSGGGGADAVVDFGGRITRDAA